MILKVRHGPDDWWFFAAERVHFYRITWRDFYEMLDQKAFELTAIDERRKPTRDAVKTESRIQEFPPQEENPVEGWPERNLGSFEAKHGLLGVVSLVTPNGEGKTIAFNTEAYLLSGIGKTVERFPGLVDPEYVK